MTGVIGPGSDAGSRAQVSVSAFNSVCAEAAVTPSFRASDEVEVVVVARLTARRP